MKIAILGKEYPGKLTLGACIDFKEETGKEFDQVSGISDVGKALYFCVKSACRIDKVKFTLSLRDFVDSLDITAATQLFTELMATVAAQAESQSLDPKKKKS